MSLHLYLVDASLNFVSGFVALFVSYYSYKYNRLLGSRTLVFLSFGFMLLAAGLISEASVHLSVSLYARPLRIFVLATTIYLILQLLAYIVIAVGYAQEAYSKATSKAAALAGSTPAAALLLSARRPPILLLPYYVSVSSELLSLVVLSIVVYQALLVYSETKNSFAALVFAALLLITVGQAVMLGGVLVVAPLIFELGELVRFFGFLSILLFLVRSGSVGPS